MNKAKQHPISPKTGLQPASPSSQGIYVPAMYAEKQSGAIPNLPRFLTQSL